MKPFQADLLMLLVTIGWGSSYLFIKIGIDSLGEFNVIALRFGLAFVLAAGLFFQRFKKIDSLTLKYAAILGFILFIVFVLITFGLNTTTTSNAGFLVSLTVVFVPLITAFLLRKKVELKVALSVVLAITGIGFLTIQLPLVFNRGDLFCMGAALFYAIHIVVMSSAAKKVDPLNLGIAQLGFTGLYGLIFSFIFEVPAWPSTTTSWLAILALSIFCSAIGFILQIIAQKYTSPTRTGLMFSLEPVFAALFGYLFAQEILHGKGYIGAALILLSVVLSSSQKKRSQSKRTSDMRNRGRNLSP